MTWFSGALVGALVLAFGPQAVLSHFDTISFSTVQQCGNFSVNFSGGKLPAALPLTLTVVPFNSTPISIILPADSWDSETASGAAVNFLPLAAGTQFVASLDDANGVGTGLVSDVIQVQSSNSTSCLGDRAASAVYSVDASVSQCAPFNVTFNARSASAPSMRTFIPRGPSFMVQEAANPTPDTATFIMPVFRDMVTVLLLTDNSTGTRQTSPLLAVDGTTTSSKSCIPTFIPAANSTASSMEIMKKTSTALSRTDIILIATIPSSIALLVSLGVVFWLCRRRRQVAVASYGFGSWEIVHSAHSEKHPRLPTPVRPVQPASPLFPDYIVDQQSLAGVSGPSTPCSSTASPVESPGGTRYVKNPAYAMGMASFVSTSILSPSQRSIVASVHSDSGVSMGGAAGPSSVASISLPSSPRRTAKKASNGRSFSRKRSGSVAPSSYSKSLRSPTSSMSSADIEHILDMATLYSTDQAGLPLVPPPVILHEGDARMSAYLAGRQSLPVSFNCVESERNTLQRPPPAVLQGGAEGNKTLGSSPLLGVESHAVTPATMYREPPTARLPHSPLPTPLPSPIPDSFPGPQNLAQARLSAVSSTMYSEDFPQDTLSKFQLLSPVSIPPRPRGEAR